VSGMFSRLYIGKGRWFRNWNWAQEHPNAAGIQSGIRIRKESGSAAPSARAREDAAFRLRNVLVKYPLEQFRRDEIEDFDKGENLLIN
jgi:hypothetical protein